MYAYFIWTIKKTWNNQNFNPFYGLATFNLNIYSPRMTILEITILNWKVNS